VNVAVTPRAVATPPDAGSEEETTKLVKVEVSIGGASGGKLKIDGELKPAWFGVDFELAPGLHTFEFVPPNETCCETPEPKTVKIRADADVQRVRGHIAFRDATVRFVGQPDSVLRCGELFTSALTAGGERLVPMNQAELHASCTVIPSPSSGKSPTAIDVTLRPGGTFTISEP
jgi:hypothetical protein